MRCKKHFSVDATSSAGVCASCLRERLYSLIGTDPRPHHPQDRRSSDQKPPHHHRHQPRLSPAVFARSVSHRKSDPSDYNRPNSFQEIRFFSTPQVDPTTTKIEKKKKSKFHMISNLFRSRSTKSAPPAPDPISGHRKIPTTLRLFSLNQSSAFDGHRGMSPAGENASDSDSDAESFSPVRFRCSPEPWKRTPRASHVRAKASPARGHVASGIGICLSPLMRPSPIRHCGKGVVGPEVVCSGEARSTVKPHLSTAGSFCSNRSRKLADFGKFNHKR